MTIQLKKDASNKTMDKHENDIIMQSSEGTNIRSNRNMFSDYDDAKEPTEKNQKHQLNTAKFP